MARRMRGLYTALIEGLRRSGVTKVELDGVEYDVTTRHGLRVVLMKTPVLAARKLLDEYGVKEPGEAWFDVLEVVLKKWWNLIHKLAEEAKAGKAIKLPTVDEFKEMIRKDVEEVLKRHAKIPA